MSKSSLSCCRLLFVSGLLLAPISSLADDLVELSGVVIDEKGQPIAGIHVIPLSPPYLGHRRSSLPDPVVSDSHGRFTLKYSASDPDQPVLLAKNMAGTRQGFASMPVRVPPRPPHFELTEKTPPRPCEWDSTARLRIMLKPARKLTAEVADAADKPVAGAVVAPCADYSFLPEESTDAAGRATLLLPADAPLNAVMASKDDVGLDYFLVRQSPEPEDETDTLARDFSGPVKFTLSGVLPMRVRIIDGKGEPLPGVEVCPWYVNLPAKGGALHLDKFKVLTDKNGRASFSSVPTGYTTRLNFWATSKTHVVQDMILAGAMGQEITATLRPALPLSGKVFYADGSPAGAAQVFAYGEGYHFFAFDSETKTDAQGRFTLLAHPNQHLSLQANVGKLCSILETFTVLEKPPEREIKLTVKAGTRVFGRVTSGEDRLPLADEYVNLDQHEKDYSLFKGLFKTDPLPNPSRDIKRIDRKISRFTVTDLQGRFEFWVPPGKEFYLASSNVPSVPFAVSDQKELEINLHSEDVEDNQFTGRVVFKKNSKQGVAKATIQGRPLTPGRRDLRAASNSSGYFRASRDATEMLIHAVTDDGRLAGIVKLGADESNREIPVAPTVTARGRLVSGDKPAQPLAEHQIDWGVRIDTSGGSYIMAFGGRITTNEAGEFEIPRLVAGWKYTLGVVLELNARKAPRFWSDVAELTPEAGQELVDLGDLALCMPKALGD